MNFAFAQVCKELFLAKTIYILCKRLFPKGVKIVEPPEKRRDLEVGKCEETQLPPSYDDLLK